MDKAIVKLVTDDIDKLTFNRLKEKYNADKAANQRKIADLKSMKNGFATYCRFGFSLLCNMGYYFTNATLENKQKMIGLISPEKLIFSKTLGKI